VRIAIVGAGISGLYAAYRLKRHHDVVLFEAKDYIGGHSQTVDIEENGQSFAVDTGFIVFNERNYPHFTALLKALRVPYQPSDMSFSFSCRSTGLEYRGGRPMTTMFVQRSNIFRRSFHRMLRDIVRFNQSAAELVTSPPDVSLGEYLTEKRFGEHMVQDYLLPMAGAIWSAPPYSVLDFPASQFGRFFDNHGLLRIRNRPQWMTVTGGSREYVRAITASLGDRVRISAPVESLRREAGHVMIKARNAPPERFDAVVLACHSDQALRMLSDPSPAERDILGSIPYQPNEAVLHTDVGMLPKRQKAWSAWNYHRFADDPDRATVTYNLTILQNLPTQRQYLVTLNASDSIDPAQVINKFIYDHPLFNQASMAAQKRHGEIDGSRNTWYCGAYWGYGFHEDGVASAAKICDALEGRQC